MKRLANDIEERLRNVALRLIDQRAAAVVVSPQHPGSGFWFGGGNVTVDPQGRLTLVGRYRNAGDSRTGLEAGQRGLELAVFRSADNGRSFQKCLGLSKTDLSVGDRHVLSIEGSALHWSNTGVELFVSTEKSNIGYPDPFRDYLKPNTGVWTIDRLQADSIEQLAGAQPVTVVQSSEPDHCHVKDPSIYDDSNGDMVLIYCTHPFTWASSNTACLVRRSGRPEFGTPRSDWLPRGSCWDVAITRATALVDLPRTGVLRDHRVRLLFYDGGESLRDLDEHAQAVSRPRGYSCEELGGVAYVLGDRLDNVFRLSQHLPMFVSPCGTGCSRYVDVLKTDAGYLATWQQSQADLSQPLVANFVPMDDLLSFLS